MTASERDQLRQAYRRWQVWAKRGAFLDYMVPAVEAILTARAHQPTPPAMAEAVAAVERVLIPLRLGMGGIGSHVDPCRLPDTPCLCGVCGARSDARALVEAALAELRAAFAPADTGEGE